ncbi:MAG: DUF3179 domain-containing protein [Pseudomonadota bacterium]
MRPMSHTLTPRLEKLPAVAAGCLLVACLALLSGCSDADGQTTSTADHFLLAAMGSDDAVAKASMLFIEENWDRSMVPMAVEAAVYTASGEIRNRMSRLMVLEAEDQNVRDINDVYFWLWNEDYEPHPEYADFKAGLYRQIDPRFERYFLDRQDSARIRLDEIRWGGVGQDGIPPLRNPDMIAAEDADYLEDDHVVFGITVNGDARAYPKRILAWHEMFTDVIGGVPIAGVYCTLCGTVIPYRTRLDDVEYELGTSGFLYRSNKLMYDKATQSLWSTERGEPVLGPLVDKGIALPFESVVTTTWGEWRRRNPSTSVLSLDTGHSRDYGEGVAYADYFATDRLMFNTPFNDQRLENKREVLALRFAGAPNQQLAIDTAFLEQNALYENRIGPQKFIVLTDASGANRVYDPGDVKFVAYDQDVTVTDVQGTQWRLDEEKLSSATGQSLPRLPYHRAFWFGWHAAFPQTQLIK